MTGRTISHYKILEKLGSGGMGVVYKAQDTRLERTVALKFLSKTAITGEKEKKRFIREAKAAAALNHANIAHVYAIEEEDDQLFIAMEFIDGQSLAEMLTSPLPLDKAIEYATQVAAGLQAAHEKGIIHRDIKSANVMITGSKPDKPGQVKVMDFGLAKLIDRSKMTQDGVPLGTTAYMSPEQARGDEVDTRTDIWSLGVVLYEMISGQLPFKGDYEQAILYSILNEEPEPLTSLRTGVPQALDGIIAKAMAKNRNTRYQHVDELPADLNAIGSRASGVSRRRTLQPSVAVPKRIAVPIMAFLAIAGFFAAWFLKPEPATPPQKIQRFSIAPYKGEQFIRDLAISPDGNFLAYVAKDEKDHRIYLRKMDQVQATPLPGTENARWGIFFSPDSRWLGFVADDKLKKISTTGGQAINITSIVNYWDFAGATWGDDDMIIFGMANAGLSRVSAAGGTPEPLTNPDLEKGEGRHIYPKLLPGGKHLLFNIVTTKKHVLFNILGSARESEQIAILSLGTNKFHVLLDQGGRVSRYVPSGHFLYWRAEGLMSVPFDIKRLELAGSPVPVFEEDVVYATVADDGSLFYLPSTPRNQRLVTVDRRGRGTSLLELPGTIRWPRVSPDGKSVAYSFQGDIWIYDTVRKTRSRIADGGGEPVWTPDGKRVAFHSSRTKGDNLYWTLSDGSGKVEPLLLKEQDTFASSWSPDGKSLAFYSPSPENKHDIWILPIGGEPSQLIGTPFDERLPMISPNGRWLAYVSNESGRDEVYVQPYPALGRRWLISNEGGNEPVWARNSRELFYRNENKMMIVTLDTEPDFRPGTPTVLFEADYVQDVNYDQSYDVTPDGLLFVMVENQDVSEPSQIHVILNWFDEVRYKIAER